MRVVVVGLGATGSHLARQLGRRPVARLQLFDTDDARLTKITAAVRAVADSSITIALGEPDPADPAGGPDVVVLASPTGTHTEVARRMLRAGCHVVSISDDPQEVAELLDLDDEARERGRSVVVGAGFVPGLSCLLARFAADRFDSVDAIGIYSAGTGGPACARQHHLALKSAGRDWRDGAWQLRRGGSGRDLVWFPEPFGARDCYRAALPSPLLLQPVFPDAARISARMAATRRDRLTSWLPMLRPPHQDGGPGAIRTEVRGRMGRAVETTVLGVMDHPSVAGATVAGVATLAVGEGRAPVGAAGLAAWPDPRWYLSQLRTRGVRVATFTGAST
jgi:saccharopine dehydrogenase-like NADP-dependent oxidoreductase